jgi:cysteine desulfurase/selenocysteine lyase
MFDVQKVRADFPILSQKVNGKPLVYFDNGATSQKPKQVIDAIVNYYEHYNSNVHRGVHTLSQQATDAYEHARENVKNYLHAADSAEIIFTKGTTEGINLVAQTWGRTNLKAGDEVLITAMEHHANIVPWQMICEEKGAILRFIPITQTGELNLSQLNNLINERTKMVALVYVSNALGIINPVETIVAKAKQVGAKVLIDGAQAVPHFHVNVQELGADFFVFSGHKLFGPTGIGVLYGKKGNIG